MTDHLIPDTNSIERFWRAANYISAGMLYLKDNVLLRAAYDQSDFKVDIVGHWGACPGVNAVYAHTTDLIRRSGQPIRLVVGTGHAGSAILANLYLEGTLAKYYEKYSRDEAGLKSLFRDFGAPGGWDTEISPEYPGMLYAGGELGAALAFAQGCAFNASGSFTVSLIGDGELETALTQASWQGFKFLNPAQDGAVLPVINANGNKMGSVSLLGLMSRSEKTAFFEGHGLTPIFAGADHDEIARAFNTAYLRLIDQNPDQYKQPVVIIETPKGWTAPEMFGAEPFAGTHRSHKPVLKKPAVDTEQANSILAWLESYNPQELFDNLGSPLPGVTACLPSPEMRLGNSHFSKLPSNITAIGDYVPEQLAHRATPGNSVKAIEQALTSLFSRHDDLLVFSPDEASSNQLGNLLRSGGMKFGKSVEGINKMGPSGKVVEVLSEHLCHAWAQGYASTERRSVLVSYEAFAPLLDSLAAQYLKFLDREKPISWRPAAVSLNIILTSLGWRNCATHHNPGFVDTLLGRGLDSVRIYSPSSPAAAQSSLVEMLSSSGLLNVMVVSKHDLPRLSAATENLRPALTFEAWHVLEGAQQSAPQISLVAMGDCMAEECLLAKDIICQEAPGLSVQVIAVQEISLFDRATRDKGKLLDKVADSVSTVWAYVGYPKTVRALLWESPSQGAQFIVGYKDRGKSAAGIARYVENEASRYHIAMAAVGPLQAQGLYDCSRIIARCQDSIASIHY